MAAKDKAKEGVEGVNGLRVTAKVNGFRRAGREWHGTTEVALSDLSNEQVEQLRAETLLLVEDIVISAENLVLDEAE